MKLRVTLNKEEARGAAERAGSVCARLHEGVTVAAHSVGVAQRGTRPTLTRRRGAHRGAWEWILILSLHMKHTGQARGRRRSHSRRRGVQGCWHRSPAPRAAMLGKGDATLAPHMAGERSPPPNPDPTCRQAHVTQSATASALSR